ncbi:helix-turn-helix transcriptional regulator [Leptolinea tardivitalis]|uniref:Cro/Cl family transcriptional regulator n=1 Tax=Leptolinea tardivitalis TaxID=229920 RepID=A0A0P6WTX4_9CHLR|nr:helix-turn-helix transcriptional regulator [Leptolinea tardivitalis]KPL73700.1 Cro/Cl family transcriptional regulator [Leptolinea tardivitalis]GAP22830.1 predicted transcriptional regulator [Leptolinea tardivitalis]
MKNILEQLRNQAGLTQQELADRVDVSRQTIISLENGRYNPSIILAFRLARLFDQPIESIFIYEEEQENDIS